MKLNSFLEAVRDYERITHEKVPLYEFCEYVNGNFYAPEHNKYLKVLPSNEWLIWAINEREGLRYLYLDQSYGFIKNFVTFLLEVMRLNSLEWIITATTRNPRAHIRKWSMTRLPEFDYEFQGRFYFALKGHKSNLK